MLFCCSVIFSYYLASESAILEDPAVVYEGVAGDVDPVDMEKYLVREQNKSSVCLKVH